MPRVGDKHYPYTAKGQAAAKAAAKRKGVKVSHGKGYNEGGSVSKSRVNLGNGAPKRKKQAVKKMNVGGPALPHQDVGTTGGDWPTSDDAFPPGYRGRGTSGYLPPEVKAFLREQRRKAKAPVKRKLRKKRKLPKPRGK